MRFCLAALMAAVCGLGGACSSSNNLADPTQTSLRIDPMSGLIADGVSRATITVTVRDSADSPVAGQMVQLIVSGHGNLIGQPSFSDASGHAVATLATTVAESKTITVKVISFLTGKFATISNSGTVDFSSGPASKLQLDVQPSTAAAGATITPAVRVGVYDANGNRVPGINMGVPITVTLGGGATGATLSGTTTVTSSQGDADFTDLAVDLAATGYTLTASADGLTSATSSSFDVTAGAPARLAFKAQPQSATAGATLAPIAIELEDAQGNLAAGNSGMVTLALASGNGTLMGTTTVQAANGVATFSDLTLTAAGTFTLAATSGSFSGATSMPFTIAPAAASKLGFPSLPAAGSVTSCVTALQTVPPCTFNVSAAVEDTYGNVVSDAGAATTITLTLKAPVPNSATLTGGAATMTTDGVSAFTGLSLNKGGKGMTFEASGMVGGSAQTADATIDVKHLTIVDAAAITPAGTTPITTGDTMRFYFVTAGHQVQTTGAATAQFCGPVNGATCVTSAAGDTFEITPAAGMYPYNDPADVAITGQQITVAP